MTDQPQERLAAVLRTVRERAALCGAVTPPDLVSGLDRDDASHALDLLAPEFDRVEASGRWLWTLRRAARSATLDPLAGDGRLAARLAEVASIPTDRAGELLRQFAQSRAVAGNENSNGTNIAFDDAPATVLQALTWARPLGGFDEDLAEAQRRAAVRSLGDGYTRLTEHGVFGRDLELAQLRRFALAPATGDEPEIPMLTMTGIGGAGKSTVLGWFLKPFLDRTEAGDLGSPGVILLDFDRVLLRPTAELELSFELTKQLGYAAPSVAAGLAEKRGQFRAEQRKSGADRLVSNVRVDSDTRESIAFEHAVGREVIRHGLQDRRLLLVLDSFEEWQRERPYPGSKRIWANSPELRILEWIGRIRSTMNLRNLRVIVSGRATLASEDQASGIRPQLAVRDLAAQPARDLLTNLGISAPAAAKLAEFVGGNPLSLHVAARFFQGLDTTAQRELLAGEPLPVDGLTAEVRRAVLYQRFLEHIPDEQIRRVAHPGLLLRRITSDLVRGVLAAPCGLGRIDAHQAARLTEKLGDEVWLVERTAHGLQHRREVRGPMLALMAGDPGYAEAGRQIHAAAVSWYENRGDGHDPLPPDLAQVEAFYHSLMLRTGDEVLAPDESPAREQWLQLAQRLRTAADELPPKVAAQVRFVRGDQISDQDATSLPDPVWHEWAEQRGRALVDEGDPTAALRLLDARQLTDLPECLGQACSDAGQWGRYWATAGRFSGLERADFLASGRYGLLNALLSEHRDDLARYRTALSGYFARRQFGEDSEADPADAERLFCNMLVEHAIASGQPWAAQLPVVANDDKGIDRFPVDQLRRLLVWIGTPKAGPDFVINNVGSFCRPDPRWMRDFAAFTGADAHRRDIGSFLVLFKNAVGSPGGLGTHELLSEWCVKYASALGTDRVRLWRTRIRATAGRLGVLRGDNPELRPAIHLALAGPAAGAGIRQLAAIAERLIPVPASNLRPSVTTDGDRPTLIQLIEYVDRAGFMREFLAETCQAWPDNAPLLRVTRAFTLWDDMNNQLLAALAEQM